MCAANHQEKNPSLADITIHMPVARIRIYICASGMARAAARTVWTMMGGRHVEETAEKSGPPRAGDHGEPGEAATGDG